MSLQERIGVLEQLEAGLVKVVESIQILDQGVDIPPLKNAILLASTGNPKQFIQRRGRVLRKWDGFYSDGTSKTHATIHDVFVIPYLTRPIDPTYMKIEKEIIKKELSRHEEMAKISRNPEFGIEKIKEIKKKFDLI
jgi:superfamily II DNA or RNA helicase